MLWTITMSGRRNTLNAQRGPTPAAAGTKTATLPAKSQVFSQGQRARSKGLWRESVESTSTSDSTRQTGSGISEMARMKRRRMDSEIWRITLLRDCGEFRLNPQSTSGFWKTRWLLFFVNIGRWISDCSGAQAERESCMLGAERVSGEMYLN